MTATLTPAQVEQQLRHAMTLRGHNPTLEDTYFEDYAKIGSFLTDKPACHARLVQLSRTLERPLADRNMVSRRIGIKRSSRYLKTTTHRDKESNEAFDTRIVKHNKVLTDFFKDWESRHDFNAGGQLADEAIRLPANPATLTDFVHADHFRGILLKHGYHWKDAGVGVRHGEFTHRIHWYMITEQNKASGNTWLANSVIDLFKALGEPKTRNLIVEEAGWSSGTPKTNIWDQIVDNGDKNASPRESPHRQFENHFRCPETLHKYINEGKDRPDIWALGYLIWGRTQKRRNESADKLRIRYQNMLQRNPEGTVARGFYTGRGVDDVSSGTVIWKDRG